MYLILLSKQSTDPWLLLIVKWNGSDSFYLISKFHIHFCFNSVVIVKLLHQPCISWAHKIHWDWLSLCSRWISSQPDITYLCSFQISICRHFHKGFCSSSLLLSSWQVGHSKSPCSNLRWSFEISIMYIC